MSECASIPHHPTLHPAMQPQRYGAMVHAVCPPQTPSQAGVLATPAALVHRCLTDLRKANVEAFQRHVPPHAVLEHPPVIRLGHLHIQEQGPLATCAPVLDTPARRLLPGTQTLS